MSNDSDSNVMDDNMSFMDALEHRGVEVTSKGTQPLGQRTQSHFGRVINVVRELEGKVNKAIRTKDSQIHERDEIIAKLQERCHKLEKKVVQFELKEALEARGDAIKEKDREEILQIAS